MALLSYVLVFSVHRQIILHTRWSADSLNHSCPLILPLLSFGHLFPGHILAAIISVTPSTPPCVSFTYPIPWPWLPSPVSLPSSSNMPTLLCSTLQSSLHCCHISIPGQGSQSTLTCWAWWSVRRAAVRQGRSCDTAGHTEWTPPGRMQPGSHGGTLWSDETGGQYSGSRGTQEGRGASCRPWRGLVSCFYPE